MSSLSLFLECFIFVRFESVVLLVAEELDDFLAAPAEKKLLISGND